MTLAFFFDGTNTVIARDVEDAKLVYAEGVGEEWTEDAGEHGEWRHGSWSGVAPVLVSCRFESWEDVPSYARTPPLSREVAGGHAVTVFLPPEEWIAGHGRGYFGSTEA
jgi:hypothetical protein